MEPIWADALCQHGSIRIQPISLFRAMEGAQGDPLDAATRYNSGDMRIADSNNSPEVVAALARAGIEVVDCKNFTVRDFTRFESLTGSALCLCARPDNKHFLQGPKTAVVRISNPVLLARCLTRLADGRLGKRAIISEVRYSDDREAFGTQLFQDPHAFVKRTRFSDEEEVRMFWPTSIGQPVDITDPSLRGLVDRIA